MRNFLAFIRRFRELLFFALLQGVALTIYFTFLSFPRSQYLTTASRVTGSVLKVRNDITKHFNLSKSNSNLQRENIRLRKKLKQSNYQVVRGKIFIDDSLFHQQYHYIPAIVLNSTHTKRNNYFTLDVGSLQGVERGDGVFSDRGVIGIVHNVSKHFCVVKSCLTENINIDIMVEKSGQFGLLKWNGKNHRHGTMWGVSNDLKIKRWSKIVTRGGGGIFPRGIPVGKIIRSEVVEGKPLWDLTILFSEDFASVQRVYIVKNLMKKEQEKLEGQFEGEENQ